MKFYKIGSYNQIAKDGDISCDCTWGSLYINNYLNGEKICWHIKGVIQRARNKPGYILIDGVPEHRIAVQRHIKRKLTKEEVVHHLDFDKQNNDIDNLMIFDTNQAHIKFHTKLKQTGMTNPLRRQVENRWDKFIKSNSQD